MRLNTDSQVPSLEICSEDRWLSLNSTLHISNEDSSAIRNLEGRPAASYFISLSWEPLDSIARYEAVCSSSQLTSTVGVDGASTSTTVAVIPVEDAYRCCVTAYRSRTLFSLVEFTSTECVSVILDRNISSELPVDPSEPPANPALTFPAESSGGQQLDPVVTYALGGLSGLLIITVVLVAVGCFCVMPSKRKDQITYPKG